MQYQVGNRRNSSPTLEVGVFLLEKDKMLYYYDNRLRVNPISFHFPEFLYLLSSFLKLPLTDFPSCQRAELQKINKAYLWPRSKVWMRAHKRTFKPQRPKSQIGFIYLLEFVCLVCIACGKSKKYPHQCRATLHPVGIFYVINK